MVKYEFVDGVKEESETEMFILEEEDAENILPDVYSEQSSKIFKCSICSKSYDYKEELTVHIRDHFKIYECKICKKKLIGDTQYDYHINHAHTIDRLRKSTQIQGQSSSSMKLENAGKVCTNKARPVKSEISEENSSDFVACDICGRICQDERAVNVHRLTHNENKDFVCDFCGKSFTRKTNLEFHCRIHTGERAFQCDLCPKAFTHVSGLVCHKRTHTGERPYKCPFCEKCFAHSTDLRRHRRSHGREEKRFECDLCNRKFFERKFLVNHMKTHEKHNGRNKTVIIKMEVQKQSDSDDYAEEFNEADIDLNL